MKGNNIVEFKEKMSSPQYGAHLVNAGVYIIEPEICKNKLPPKAMFEHDVFPELAKKKKLIGYQLNSNWVHLHSEELLNFYKSKKIV